MRENRPVPASILHEICAASDPRDLAAPLQALPRRHADGGRQHHHRPLRQSGVDAEHGGGRPALLAQPSCRDRAQAGLFLGAGGGADGVHRHQHRPRQHRGGGGAGGRRHPGAGGLADRAARGGGWRGLAARLPSVGWQWTGLLAGGEERDHEPPGRAWPNGRMPRAAGAPAIWRRWRGWPMRARRRPCCSWPSGRTAPPSGWPATSIPTYAAAFAAVDRAKVRILAYDCTVSPAGIELRKPLTILWN